MAAQFDVAVADVLDDVEAPLEQTDQPPRRRRPRLLQLPHFGGLAMALLFWWQSLTPSLMPRSWLAQAAVSAVCLAVGCALGTLGGSLVHRLLARFDRRPTERVTHVAWRALAVIAAVVVIVGLAMWPRWQNEHRDLMTLEHVSPAWVVPIVLLTAVLTLFLVVVGRLVWRGVRAVDRWLSRHMPRPMASLAAVIIVLLFGRYLATGAFDRFHTWANTQFGRVDDETDDGVVQPDAPTVSGSPDSLLAWDDLGREGRNFVTRTTSQADLAAFHGDGAITEPVRVYAGLRSGDSAEERAQLAVRDLERAGGFERAILVVTTVTGTGWVDPDAARAVEQLWAGDTAMVAIQYSYLPSWISTLVDGDVASAAGVELFDAVHRRWLELPEDSRPQLVVFGQSLGSFGGEAAFAGYDATSSIANLVARTDGALFTGPTNANPIWTQLTDDRDAGSPAWKPVIEGGRSVRFANTAEELLEVDPAWEFPRVLYVQHPSDPVTFWDVPTMWSSPEWVDDPTGADVPDRVTWFPFVTWAQGVADLAAGFGAKPGFGHDYSNAFVAAWAAVAAPQGWSADDTVRLEQFLGVR